MFIGGVLCQFLVDKDGIVEQLKMKFSKPNKESGTKFKDTPARLPDISMAKLSGIDSEPHQVVPERSALFNVPQYEEIKRHYDNVQNIVRVKLLDKFAF